MLFYTPTTDCPNCVFFTTKEHLVEISPKELRYNKQKCDDITFGDLQVQTNVYPSRKYPSLFTLKTDVDKLNVQSIYFSLPIHPYPISCRVKNWNIKALIPSTG